MLKAAAFLGITLTGYLLAIAIGPFYGLITYAYVYFVPPISETNWWASYLPFSRWSLLSSAVLMISIMFHRDKLVKHELRSIHWLYVFVVLTLLITLTTADNRPDTNEYTYKLLTYAITVWYIARIINSVEQYRGFLLTIIVLIGHLSVKAYTEGKRVHARLENIGANDTIGSNEFGLLLAGVIPLLIPFMLQGKRYEKLTSILLLPFILNAFILCNSRGAGVALAGGLIYTALLIADKNLRRKIIVSVICLIPLFLYLSDAEYLARISSLWTTEEARQNEVVMNELSSGRVEIWKYGMRMVKDHPMGAGPNSFKDLARFYMPPEILTYHPGAEYGIRAAHNTYLQVLVEQGYLGLLIWVIMCIHTMFLLWSGARKLNRLGISNTFMGLTMAAMNISFVCTLVGGLVGSRVYYEFFWWQVALSVVAYSFVLEIEKMELSEKGQVIYG